MLDAELGAQMHRDRFFAAATGWFAVLAVGALRDVLIGVEAGTLGAVFSLTAVVLVAIGLAAAGWPAWRASRTSPMEALRCE